MAGKKGRSGRRPGWGKSVEEHIAAGTYRHDRHGPKEPVVFSPPPKPPGIVRATVRSQQKWVRSEADARALANGCRFNEPLAEHVATCFEKYLCHSKGQWAGKPFILTEWQRENIIWPLFGWVREDGTRRFRRTYIEIPKKNYKSTTASGIGLYMECFDEEAGAEVYSLGADKDQARVVHNEAINMVEASDELKRFLQINRTTGTIAFEQTRSVYRALSGAIRGKHGLNIHCAIADELHEWHGDELWNSIKYGFRARRQPLLLVITNAGDNKDSVCGAQHDKARAILDGKLFDESFFALICSASREEAIDELEEVRKGATELPVARRCNPGLGHVISERDVLDEVRDALQTPSELPNLLRLTYSVWVAGGEPWLDYGAWQKSHDEAAGKLWYNGERWQYTGDMLRGQGCAGGLDLSKSKDFTAFTFVFPSKSMDEYWQLPMFWLPEVTAEHRAALEDYDKWAEAGWLRLLPGEVVDYDAVFEDIIQVAKDFDLRQILYDPWNCEPMRQRFERAGIFCAQFQQSIRNFANPTAEYERLLLEGKLHHCGNEVMTWQASHVEVKADQNKNKRPVKRAPGDHRTIDGLVSAIMGLQGASELTPVAGYYDSNNLEWS